MCGAPAQALFRSAATRTSPRHSSRRPGYVRYWDDVAKVPWLYNAERKEWISYEDPQSMRLKGEYIAAQNLSGAMFWELSNDDGRLLEALRAGLGRR